MGNQYCNGNLGHMSDKSVLHDPHGNLNNDSLKQDMCNMKNCLSLLQRNYRVWLIGSNRRTRYGLQVMTESSQCLKWNVKAHISFTVAQLQPTYTVVIYLLLLLFFILHLKQPCRRRFRLSGPVKVLHRYVIVTQFPLPSVLEFQPYWSQRLCKYSTYVSGREGGKSIATVVTDEPDEFEKQPVKVHGFRKITHRFKGICGIYFKLLKNS